jgi:hypothetical protein
VFAWVESVMVTSTHMGIKTVTPMVMPIDLVMEHLGNLPTTTIRDSRIDPRSIVTIRIRTTTIRRPATTPPHVTMQIRADAMELATRHDISARTVMLS